MDECDWVWKRIIGCSRLEALSKLDVDLGLIRKTGFRRKACLQEHWDKEYTKPWTMHSDLSRTKLKGSCHGKSCQEITRDIIRGLFLYYLGRKNDTITRWNPKCGSENSDPHKSRWRTTSQTRTRSDRSWYYCRNRTIHPTIIQHVVQYACWILSANCSRGGKVNQVKIWNPYMAAISAPPMALKVSGKDDPRVQNRAR